MKRNLQNGFWDQQIFPSYHREASRRRAECCPRWRGSAASRKLSRLSCIIGHVPAATSQQKTWPENNSAGPASPAVHAFAHTGRSQARNTFTPGARSSRCAKRASRTRDSSSFRAKRRDVYDRPVDIPGRSASATPSSISATSPASVRWSTVAAVQAAAGSPERRRRSSLARSSAALETGPPASVAPDPREPMPIKWGEGISRHRRQRLARNCFTTMSADN